MGRWAEFVLRHRRWVVVAWIGIILIGGALFKTVQNRLTVDFSLPGQPGTVFVKNGKYAVYHNPGSDCQFKSLYAVGCVGGVWVTTWATMRGFGGWRLAT